MNYVIAFLGFLTSFLVLDSIWISQVVVGMYRTQVNHLMAQDANVLAAVLFYILYAAAAVFFCRPAIKRGSPRLAVVYGGTTGGLAYGTYALTNFAVLDGWTWQLVVADVLWGITVTAVCCAIAVFVTRWRNTSVT
ncbi:membrane protein [Arenicella chitinivorans]|uniref:Membrane protein n=1 Tax=Arenicella chitinivorans TaxID=1329800 RepID=A0A918RHD1_9GAMM|nr:DUF2177 family protein [Arenicella chitinivorans]GGZ98121.1 membrane protein [Arenicella chitinivorans]